MGDEETERTKWVILFLAVVPLLSLTLLLALLVVGWSTQGVWPHSPFEAQKDPRLVNPAYAFPMLWYPTVWSNTICVFGAFALVPISLGLAVFSRSGRRLGFLGAALLWTAQSAIWFCDPGGVIDWVLD